MRKLLLLCLMLVGAEAYGYNMTNSFSITSGSQIWPLQGLNVTGTNYVWMLPDASGVNMQSYGISNTFNSSNIVFDLGGGQFIGNGPIVSSNTSGNSANVTITNVGAIATGIIDTHPSKSGGYFGGNITIGTSNNPAGSLSIAGFITGPSGAWGGNINTAGNVTVYSGAINTTNINTTVSGAFGSGGNIFIRHTGSLIASNILAYAETGSGESLGGAINITGSNTFYALTLDSSGNGATTTSPLYGGDITLGGYTGSVTVVEMVDSTVGRSSGNASGKRAGNIVIGTSVNRVGAVTIGGIQSYVTSSSFTGAANYGGSISIYSSGSILIATNILAGGWGVGRQGAGTITLNHTSGNLSAGTLDASVTNGWPDAVTSIPQSITVDGNSGGGNCTISTITAYFTGDSGNRGASPNGGNITVRNYSSVIISNGVNASTINLRTGTRGGDLIITNIVNGITVGGSINLSSAIAGNNGSINMQSTQDGIILGALDMTKVSTARLDFATSGSITGALNFVSTYSSGSGTAGDPYLTTQQMLRVTSGKTVYYADIPANAYLGYKVYRVADLSGTAGAGGLLTPKYFKVRLTSANKVRGNPTGGMRITY